MTDDLVHDPGLDAAAPAADPAALAEGTSLAAGEASLLALIDRLAVLLERSDLLELEVESGGTGIVLRKPAAMAQGLSVVAPASAPAAVEGRGGAGSGPSRGAPAGGPGGDPTPSAAAAVLAPLTGIFYASPSPGSPPFVAVGREVVVGQVIGLIEAMKLFNEIKSDKAGRVVRVVAENGALVKAKHPLIEVEPL
jgi:acetyl-CoA carboxylase biotin carboxyl carrier protein